MRKITLAASTLFFITVIYNIGVLSRLDIKNEVNISDLLSVLTTLFLAIYIPKIVEKRIADNRVEKDVLIKRIESVQDVFNTIHGIVNLTISPTVMTAEQTTVILSSFTQLSQKLSNLKYLLNHCGYEELQQDLTSIINNRLKYKRIVTGGNFQQPNFSYTINQQNKESVLYQSIELNLSLLIIRINKQ